ncbi:MAG: LysE family transporter [Alcaligenaceae bacterium]|nr:LysE family transporter [Alcaligenaceae bacterium]
MQFETWLVFLLASVGLSLSPGPNGLLALTHGAIHGTRRTSYTILGGAVGFIAIIALCMFGIGALIKASVVWLTILKWVGGLYLVWLGIQVWRSPAIAITTLSKPVHTKGRTLFLQGLLSAGTNPKGLLFFSAFLPQFIDPHRSLFEQFVVVAATFAATEALTEYGLAGAAHRVRPWLARVGKRFNQACGGLFIAIGAVLPLRT